MSYRTCDLDHLAAHLRLLGGDRPCTVAVSGFPASGKSTLARLLADRLEDASVTPVDELLAAGTTAKDVALTPDLPADLAAAHHTVVEQVRAERTGWQILEGTHLLHPDLHDLAEVHVWLDVDLNRANGNALTREAEKRRRRRDRRPLGSWSTEPPTPQPATPAERFFDRHHPDRSADALFVPVGRMVPPVEVRFMDEAVDFVLWDEGNHLLGELEDLLPMSEHLRDRIKSWARESYRLPVDGPSDRGADGRSRQARGLALSVELQRELGPEWTVTPVGLGEPV